MINKPGRSPEVGRSDYGGVRYLLFALNEAVTIGHENARLVAKKPLVVPSSLLNDDAEFDAGADVIRADAGAEEYGKGSGPVTAVEYSFDAEALIPYQRNLVETILNRCGIVGQFTGTDTRDGLAQSGTRAEGAVDPGTRRAPWPAHRAQRRGNAASVR